SKAVAISSPSTCCATTRPPRSEHDGSRCSIVGILHRGPAMLLTRKSEHAVGAPTSLVHSLSRGVARAIPTLDRRSFLRRSGLGLGAGMATSQLLLVRKAK